MCVCWCVCERASERESWEQISHPERKRGRVNSCLHCCPSGWGPPAGQPNYERRNSSSPKYALLWRGGERERGGRGQKKKEKCSAQDPVGSHSAHLANTLINILSLPLTRTYMQTHSSVVWLNSDVFFVAFVSFVRGVDSVFSSFFPHGSFLPSLPCAGRRETETESTSNTTLDAFLKSSGLFSSFQPTEDLICYNLISGWNHTAYISNIKYLQFSLSGHLAENRNKVFYFISRVFPLPFTLFHLALKRASDLSSNYHLFLSKEGMFKCCGCSGSQEGGWLQKDFKSTTCSEVRNLLTHYIRPI